MASQNLNPRSIHSSDCAEKIGIAVGGSHVKTDSSRSSGKTEEKEESFMASDLFFQKMGTMINKQDVQSILNKQTETLTKFEKTNAKFGKFNDLSAARYLHLNQQLKNHTKMLLDMKKDLDSVFRRIRNLKTKLTKQYGPAFHATSAGIQKLEEELGASIENEDSSSLSTLTESKELSCDSQSINPGLAVRNEGIAKQKIEEDMSQSTGLSTENKNAATTETEIQLQGNDKSILVSSAQVNEVMNRTEETEDVIRTAKTTDMNWTEDTDDTVQTEDTSCKTETVDTDNTYQAVDESDQTETVDTDNTYRTVETGDTIQTVDTSDMHQTQGSGYPSETVDTHDMTECKDINDMERMVDTSDVTRTVDTSNVTRTVDPSDKSQSEDTNDMCQTLETSELSEGDNRNK